MTEDRTSFPTALFAPLLIALVGLVIFAGGQTVAAFHDHGVLLAARDGQTNAMQQSVRMRQQVEKLASGVAQLAQAGDSDAQSIVAQFAKTGVRFASPTQAANPAPGK